MEFKIKSTYYVYIKDDVAYITNNFYDIDGKSILVDKESIEVITCNVISELSFIQKLKLLFKAKA